MRSRKISLSEVPAAVLTFVFIALIGGVGMIILAEFNADTSDANATQFIGNAQNGITKIGNKLTLVGTIIILSVIIGLVITYFAVRNVWGSLNEIPKDEP